MEMNTPNNVVSPDPSFMQSPQQGLQPDDELRITTTAEQKKQSKNNNSKNNSSKNKKNQDSGLHIPQNVSDSIPYKGVYQNGIFELEDSRFSKSYKLPEMNFKIVEENRQQQIAIQYSEFITSFAEGTSIEITLYNKTMNMDVFQDQVFIKMKNDNLNKYREEYNQMLKDKMVGVKNNLDTVKILTVTIKADDIFEANDKFIQIDAMIADSLGSMTGSPVVPLTLMERLDMLFHIYNPDSDYNINEKRTINGQLVEAFNLENCANQGITTKDVIGPPSMEFKSNIAKVGDRIAKSFFVANYPTWLKGTLLTDFSSIPTNMLVSVHMVSMDQSEAIKLVKRQGVNINSAVVEAQKRAVKNGYDPSIISEDLKDARHEQKLLMDNITKENAKLFTTTFVFTLFANTEEEMKGFEDQLKLIGNKNMIMIQPLNLQQEDGLASSLPIGNNRIKINRLMTSQTIGAIIPFDVKNVRQQGGLYYGLNAVSQTMILYNRTSEVNTNSCILGMPGAGKSFTAKREMINVLLNTDDEVYVIDPEREYKVIADALGGSVIKIANGSSIHLNPFDLNLKNQDEDGGDPVKVKSDFIETICEIMIGGKYGLSPIEKSIIDRSATNIYDDYIKYLQKTNKDQDYEHAPTMVDFYNDLLEQALPEAQNIALSLERYVKGALDIFSHHTNTEIRNRFTIYDIKEIGPGLKEMGLQICLDNIWNKMIRNATEGKRTWFYIDEFYLMMQKPTSASYISEIWKRARKWKGNPCAITQNVEDMLKSEDARTVINNCSFVTMLGQSPINKTQLSSMYNLSLAEQKYIASAKPGMGIIICNGDVIPMNDDFPKNTELYQMMTTKPEERIY